MKLDGYTKAVLTLIAAALTVIAANPWLAPDDGRRVVGARLAEAQTPQAPPTPATPQAPPRPAQAPQAAPVPVAPPPMSPWWDDCSVLSKETIPVGWGKLAGIAPGSFVFESSDTIRLARFAAYEPVSVDPTKKPCKVLEIKRSK